MDVDERKKLKCYQKFKDKEMNFESLGMKKQRSQKNNNNKVQKYGFSFEEARLWKIVITNYLVHCVLIFFFL